MTDRDRQINRERWTFVALLIVFLCLLTWRARAEEVFELQKPSCYPVFGAGVGDTIEAQVLMGDGPDVGVWWCTTPTGMEANFRGGEWGSLCESCFREAIKSLASLWTLDSGRIKRQLTSTESAMVERLERSYEPRCTFATTAKTSQVLSKALDGTIGPARTDEAGKGIRWTTTPDRPSCWSWIVAGTKRWCSVSGLTDTMGRNIGPDSYVPCKIALAPAEGWQ